MHGVFGQAATAVTVASDAATDLVTVGTDVVIALIPIAVGFILIKKALPWARRFAGV